VTYDDGCKYKRDNSLGVMLVCCGRVVANGGGLRAVLVGSGVARAIRAWTSTVMTTGRSNASKA
jgi:hypothetical protein